MNHNIPRNTPISMILKSAFGYWNAGMKYNLLYSLLYFTLVSVFTQFLLKYFGLEMTLMKFFNEVIQNPKIDPVGFDKELKRIMFTEEFQLFKVVMVFFTALLFPLNIGFFNIYQKMDRKEDIVTADFFIGYESIHFFKYFSFATSWGMIYNFAQSYSVLAVIWVLGTLFAAPLLFFKNERLGIALAESFKALFRNFILIFICGTVTMLFKFSGLLLFLAGILLTFPFWNAMIYSLYKNIFIETPTKPSEHV